MAKNTDRAERARKTLEYYAHLINDPYEPNRGQLMDFITDCFHLLVCNDPDNDPVAWLESELPSIALNFEAERANERAK